MKPEQRGNVGKMRKMRRKKENLVPNLKFGNIYQPNLENLGEMQEKQKYFRKNRKKNEKMEK